MKHTSTSFNTHLQQEVTTLATCWKLRRRDNTTLGFTDHDRDLVVDGISYQAASGFTPTAIDSSAALNVDNLDIEGLLNSDTISEGDILAGKYDFAELEIFLVNYADLSQGRMILRTGWLGEVQWRGAQFVAEMRGLTQQLQTRIGSHYGPACRADLGDDRCGLSLAGYSVTGMISAGGSRGQCTDSARSEAAGYFAGGTIRFTSGPNNDLRMEIKEFQNGQFILVLPLPDVIDAGDQYVAVAGCDKTLSSCINRFDNAVNFRGEPHIPGTDKMLETAATRNEAL